MSPFTGETYRLKATLQTESRLDRDANGSPPAATRTSFETSTAPSDTPLAAYDASRAKYLVAYERVMAVADTAESVAETIVRAARDKTPRLRYPSGKAARQVAFARRFVPRALFDKILRSQFGLA